MADTDSVLAADSRFVWHPYTSDPVVGPRALITRGRGAYLYDDSGKAYFDSSSSWWCVLHGHCHPRLVKAIQTQAAKLDHLLFAPHTHEVAVELAEMLLALLGAPFSKVFFSDDGSTAVEAALKMALQYWNNRGESGRRYFLSLEEGYHGDTLGAISVGYVREFHHFFDMAIRPSLKAMQPYCYRCPVDKKYPQCALSCLNGVEALLEARGHEIAALIVEPLVMGAAGMVVYPTDYLEKLISLCKAKGVLVIFDEVFTGFGRTGKYFALDHLTDRPDLVALSKGLTSGTLPLGATVATDTVYEAFKGAESKKFYHGHTFSANPVSCAVALESLRLLEEEKVLSRNEALVRLMSEQVPRFESLDVVGDVRHFGMIWAAELVRSKASKAIPQPANGPGWKICERLWEKGIWMRPMHNVLYVVPPYCTTEAELGECFDSLYEEIRNVRDFCI
ncbi:MAG: adenosylmethionine--8-amino-7-oxononanoate transaminase [Bdellovibrionales bacterium]|nr:adenosylmethionine--8-amino-7-oxononanoate transaminase [Bdellovibrionales bacterium]